MPFSFVRFAVVVGCVISLTYAPAGRADLNDDIRAVLKDKLLQKGEAGVEVIKLSGPEPRIVFRHNSDIPLIPASNLKLVTTSALLDKVGKDFKFRTVLARRGNDLAVVGDGDPTLGDAELLKKVGWETTTVFKNWAGVLSKLGIKQVDHLLVDDSVFDQEFFHPSWPLNQENRRYVAQVGGLSLNANCLDFYMKPDAFGELASYVTDPPTKYATIKNECVTGAKDTIDPARKRGTNEIDLRGEVSVPNNAPSSVTIHDPSMFAGTVLAETLESNGINITGSVARDLSVRRAIEAAGRPTQSGWQIIAIHETPLDVALDRANKDSMNQYAEAMCKRLGFATSGQPGSWSNGHAAITEFLTKAVGVPSDQYDLDDGCGLSKKNAVSANVLAQILRYDFASANKDVFFASLAVAGVDGTFESRFKGTTLQRRVFGKSGYVSGVSSLSGYLWTKDGQWYAFSILLNGIPEGMNSGAKTLQEKIVQAVDAYASAGLAKSPARQIGEEKAEAR